MFRHKGFALSAIRLAQELLGVLLPTFGQRGRTVDRLDRYFGVHGTALTLRSERMHILASNIANAATPGYKARDLDFSQVTTQ